MAQRRATIHDVATAAGVSVTTVSQALNGKGRVDAATRERVRAAATGLGYRASHVARGLRAGRTWAVGLMLPHSDGGAAGAGFIGVEFYLELALGAARSTFTAGHALTLLPDVTTADELARFPLDGVIVNDPVPADPRLRALDELGVPWVTVERALDRPEHVRWVASDTNAGTRAALDQLAAAGASRVALLSGSPSWAWLSDTEAAYRDWCAERQVEALVVDAGLESSREAHVPAAVERVLGTADAIFAAPDRSAVAAARAIESHGLRVGEDVLVASGTDSRQARDHVPPISALDLHPEALASAAVSLLLAPDEPARPTVLAPTFRARASSRGGGSVR
jgi:DNA-binding LacI/PurR family transcriptional regulator